MNTNMIGFICFSKIIVSVYFGTKVVLASEGLKNK